MYIQTNQFNPLKLVDLSIIDEKIDEIDYKDYIASSDEEEDEEDEEENLADMERK